MSEPRLLLDIQTADGPLKNNLRSESSEGGKREGGVTSSLARRRRDVDGLLGRVCTVPALKWSAIDGDE